jgi:transcriptional regulator with XRE-family HTH domain
MKQVQPGIYISGLPLLRKFEGVPDHIVAERLGVGRMTVMEWRHGRRIHWRKADEYACRIGLHPYSVWGDEWFLGAFSSRRNRKKVEV